MSRVPSWIWTLISMVAFTVIILTLVYLSAQNRRTLEQTQQAIEEIREQGLINQRYIRCILLLESKTFKDKNALSEALDDCARSSQVPSDFDSSATSTPPEEDRQTEEPGQPSSDSKRQESKATPRSIPRESVAPTKPKQPENPEQPNLVESVGGFLDEVTRPLQELF